MTNNHDMPRVTAYLDKEAIKLVNAFIFTMPGVPFLYYGDEIGMRYQKGHRKQGGRLLKNRLPYSYAVEQR